MIRSYDDDTEIQKSPAPSCRSTGYVTQVTQVTQVQVPSLLTVSRT
jgi:hypothetical protein